LSEVSLGLGTQLTQGSIRLEQGGTKTAGKSPKRLATLDGVRLGYPIEIIGREEPSLHGEGDGRRQVQPIDLVSHLTGDKLKSRLHFGHHPLGFVDAIEAALAELFVLDHGTNRLDLRADIGGDQLAVSPHAAFQVDNVIGRADGLQALFDLLALLSQSLVLMAGCFKGLLSLLTAQGRFWRTAWTPLFKLIIGALQTGLGLLKLFLGLAERLVSGSFFGGQRCANGLAEFMLNVESVGRVMRPELVFDIGPNPRRLITGGWNHFTVELGQSRCHQGLPGCLITGLSELCQDHEGTHRIAGHQAKAAGEGCVLGHGDNLARHGLGQAWGFRVLVVDDGLVDLNVDWLLSPIGSGTKAVQAGEVEQKTDPPNAASTDLDTDPMQGSNEPMQEGQARTALKKLGHLGTDIEGLLPGLPSLKGGAGHLKRLGGLALGDPLSLQIEIVLEQIGPLKSVPELRAVGRAVEIVAVWKIRASTQSGTSCRRSRTLKS
jgi:hypothetical protein